jgi:hypothetical protein
MFQTTNQLKVFAPGIDRFDLWLLDHGASHAAVLRCVISHFCACPVKTPGSSLIHYH